MSPSAAPAVGAAARRLLLVLGCLAFFGSGENAAARRYPDEEVLANLEYYPMSWGKYYQGGDAESCGKAYLDSAALHVALLESCSALTAKTGWKDGMVVRGTSAITEFWTKAVAVLGKVYVAGAASGDFKERRFVVDDDTVIVEGKVSWGDAQGRRLSQTWKRQGAGWKIASEMIVMEAYTPPSTTAPAAQLRGEVEKLVEAAEGKKSGAEIAKEALDIGKAVVKEVAKEAPAVAEAAKAAEKQEEAKPEAIAENAAEAAAIAEAAANPGKTGSSNLSLFVCALLLGGVGTFAYRRSRRRREATIAGFEAMLG